VSTAKLDDLIKAIDEINKIAAPKNDYLGMNFNSQFMGMRVYEKPLFPVLQLSKDVVCTDERRKKFNQWAIELFGYKSDEPDIAYMFNNNILMSPSSMAMLINTTA